MARTKKAPKSKSETSGSKTMTLRYSEGLFEVGYDPAVAGKKLDALTPKNIHSLKHNKKSKISKAYFDPANYVRQPGNEDIDLRRSAGAFAVEQFQLAQDAGREVINELPHVLKEAAHVAVQSAISSGKLTSEETR